MSTSFSISLFTTLGCHLCEEAQALVLAYKAEMKMDFNLFLVEISDEQSLIDLYGDRIPVLQHSQTKQELAWPFSKEELSLFLAQ